MDENQQTIKEEIADLLVKGGRRQLAVVKNY